MEKSRIKKVMAVLLAILFVVSLTAVAACAGGHGGHGGHMTGSMMVSNDGVSGTGTGVNSAIHVNLDRRR